MNVYFRNLHNVVRTYSRQASKRSLWRRPKDAQDKVSISQEGRRLMEKMARQFERKTEHQGTDGNRKLFFKVLNSENGEEILKEIPPEEQGKVLERLVSKILKEKGEGNEN